MMSICRMEQVGLGERVRPRRGTGGIRVLFENFSRCLVCGWAGAGVRGGGKVKHVWLMVVLGAGI